MDRQLPNSQHSKYELAIKQRRPIVVKRVVAVRECLVRILVHANIVQAVRICEICIEGKALVSANPVGKKSRIIVRESETRPIEEVGKLCCGVGGRAQYELRLNAIEHIPHPLVGYVAGKSRCHPRSTARELWSTECATPGQNGFEERLRGNICLAGDLLREKVESLSKCLSSSEHEERDLIQIDTLIDIPGGVAHVPDFHSAFSRQLALNGDIPGVM